jgi:ribosomal protein L11 methyltransferase
MGEASRPGRRFSVLFEAMPWIRVTVDVGGADTETIDKRLHDLGAVALSYVDAGDTPILEPKGPDFAGWPDVSISGLFAMDADIPGLRAALANQRVQVDFLADEEWSNAWRHFAEVREFGPLTVAPSDADVDASLVLRLDPGLAFGTGGHPTTRLCLEWLVGRSIAELTMLDYGCGSGILSLAAKLLGASRVVSVDDDEQALIATRANAVRNDVVLHAYRALQQDLQFDVVVSNILSETLIELAPRLTRALNATGQLVLSGILGHQVDRVMSAYPGLRFHPPSQVNEWVLLHGERA